jgi:hypothetical protein
MTQIPAPSVADGGMRLEVSHDPFLGRHYLPQLFG